MLDIIAQRFFIMHESGDIYVETPSLYAGTQNIRALMNSSFVYDRLSDGTWKVMKDRTNGHHTQTLPSDEDLFMMILSAKDVKEYVHK
jgi:hypothetical protein